MRQNVVVAQQGHTAATSTQLMMKELHLVFRWTFLLLHIFGK